jgi:hypothetical protein
MPDHYATLGVSRSADDAEIKKAYRKEALKWHPDKNPDKKDLAEKRFKEISQAFKVLSDPDERAHYDRYGQERDAGGRPPPRRHGGHAPVYAEELSPEDIFNMFFGMPPRGHHQRPQPRHNHYARHGQHGGVQVQGLLQFAPFFLLIFFSVVSSLPGLNGDSVPYSLHRADSYGLERSTESLGVRYWVGETFELYHADAASLRKVEDRVEADNLQRVRKRCSAERLSKQKMVDAANAHQGSERTRMFEAADAVHMRWCEEKDRLEAVRAR